MKNDANYTSKNKMKNNFMEMAVSMIAAFLLMAGMVMGQEQAALPFSIKGKIDDVGQPAKVVLQYAYEGKRRSDTTELLQGKFAFSGKINKPDRATLFLLKSSDNRRLMLSFNYANEVIGKDGIVLYLDEGAITVSGPTLKTATVKGSKSHEEYQVLQKMLRPVHEKLEAIAAQINAIPAAERKGEVYEKLVAKRSMAFREASLINDDFIKSNLQSYVAWNMVKSKSIITDPVTHKAQLYAFGDDFLKSEDGKRAIERLEVALRTAMGQTAPDFTQNDIDGKPVRLSALRGKYVLIDFWASWCGPCRAENPYVKTAYDKFRNKNFEILAVSLDKSKEAWLKAIADDGLPWIHVSDLKLWDNAVGKLYNVRAVPQNFLIDPKGIIIAKNLRGKELETKLAEVLK